MSADASPARGEASPYLHLVLRTGSIPPTALKEMEKELADQMRAAGFVTDWEDPQRYDAVDGYMVIIDLDGDCRVPFHADLGSEVPVQGVHIGTTATAGGDILPFINVDCEALRTLLTPLVKDEPETSRDYAMGRSIGRVLAHELYHFLSQSEDHPDSGLAKSRFSGSDLMKYKFEFDQSALTRMQPAPVVESAPEVVVASEGSIETGLK